MTFRLNPASSLWSSSRSAISRKTGACRSADCVRLWGITGGRGRGRRARGCDWRNDGRPGLPSVSDGAALPDRELRSGSLWFARQSGAHSGCRHGHAGSRFQRDAGPHFTVYDFDSAVLAGARVLHDSGNAWPCGLGFWRAAWSSPPCSFSGRTFMDAALVDIIGGLATLLALAFFFTKVWRPRKAWRYPGEAAAPVRTRRGKADRSGESCQDGLRFCCWHGGRDRLGRAFRESGARSSFLASARFRDCICK